MINFSIPGQPQGKGRARIGRVGGFARMYTPEKTAAYEGLVAHAAHVAMAGRELMQGPASVRLELACQIPTSWSKKRQAAAIDGVIVPISKPDADNVVKAVFDGLNGVVWRDDAQVVSLSVRKRYAETPRVDVWIGELDSI